MSEAEEPTVDVDQAQEIGYCFIQRYYDTLCGSPHKMHNFYCKASQYTYAVGSQDPSSVSGQEAIFKKIAELGFDDVRVDFESGSVDIQPSPQSGNVMVMVTGTFSMKGQAPKPFVQTMLLAKFDRGYYVVNDVCRVLDKEELLKSCDREVHGINRELEDVVVGPLPFIEQPNSEVAPDTDCTTEQVEVCASTKASDDNMASKPEQGPDQIWDEVVDNGEDLAHAVVDPTQFQENEGNSAEGDGIAMCNGEEEEKEEQDDTMAVTTESTTASTDQPSLKSTEPPKKPSYAAALLMANNAPTIVPMPRKRPVETTSVAPMPSKAPAATSHRAERKPLRRSEGGSVFVRNIDTNTTEQDVKAIYEQFGAIANVSLRGERGFGFIEFTDASSVQKALEAQGNQMFESAFVIEERRNTGRGRGGRFGQDDRRDIRRGGRRGGRTGVRGRMSSHGRGERR